LGVQTSRALRRVPIRGDLDLWPGGGLTWPHPGYQLGHPYHPGAEVQESLRPKKMEEACSSRQVVPNLNPRFLIFVRDREGRFVLWQKKPDGRSLNLCHHGPREKKKK